MGNLVTICLALIALHHPTLSEGQRLFYNGQYDAAAALTLVLRTQEPENLAALELRTSTLLFQIKRALGARPDKAKALKECDTCPALIATFLSETAKGQMLARARIQANSTDEAARFFLGKLDLNYVWLQLGELGHRTGWNEYWEARKSLDLVLAHHPQDVRARVARAWIDYIVDTRMPRGTRWILGGGSRKRALVAMREAAATDAGFFIHAEAAFALWDLQVREHDLPDAVAVARDLARAFPANRELARFLEQHDSGQTGSLSTWQSFR